MIVGFGVFCVCVVFGVSGVVFRLFVCFSVTVRNTVLLGPGSLSF